MDIYSLIKLVGGLAFFLYGMNVMSDGLEKSSDGKIEKYLGTITKNKFFTIFCKKYASEGCLCQF